MRSAMLEACYLASSVDCTTNTQTRRGVRRADRTRQEAKHSGIASVLDAKLYLASNFRTFRPIF
jgi:hypothetical protein